MSGRPLRAHAAGRAVVPDERAFRLADGDVRAQVPRPAAGGSADTAAPARRARSARRNALRNAQGSAVPGAAAQPAPASRRSVQWRVDGADAWGFTFVAPVLDRAAGGPGGQCASTEPARRLAI